MTPLSTSPTNAFDLREIRWALIEWKDRYVTLWKDYRKATKQDIKWVATMGGYVPRITK